MADDLIDVAFMARAVAPSVTLRDLTVEGIQREAVTILAVGAGDWPSDYVRGFFDGMFARQMAVGPVFFGRVQ